METEKLKCYYLFGLFTNFAQFFELSVSLTQGRSQGVCKGCPGTPLGEKNGWRRVQG